MTQRECEFSDEDTHQVIVTVSTTFYRVKIEHTGGEVTLRLNQARELAKFILDTTG